MPGPFRTYLQAGDFISVDLGQHAPPTHWERFWDISEEAYQSLYLSSIPAIYPDDALGVEEDKFPPP